MNRFRLFILSLITALLMTACADSDAPPQNTAHPSSSDTLQVKTGQLLSQRYRNAKYDITLKYPENWILLEEQNLSSPMGSFAINLIKPGTGAEQQTPLHVHAEAQHSYVAIWPYGYGTELPASQYTQLDSLEYIPDFQFEVDRGESKALLLRDGTVWAYSIVPANPPSDWEEYGFIFAQIASKNHHATCYDGQTGEKKPINRCDLLGGDDRYVREADLNQEDKQTIRHVLESISLEQIQEEAKASNLIKVETPAPNTEITSPLMIEGKARGTWYHEGSFHVQLVDSKGNVLAEKQIQARGQWMTEDWVSFEATLQFDAPVGERGYLIFHRANPSGLSENAMEWYQPVTFPPA